METHSKQPITAKELLAEVAVMMNTVNSHQEDSMLPPTFHQQLHRLLVLCCHQGTHDAGQAFGNLFAQVDYLCQIHHVSIPHRIAIQEMRRHSNHRDPITKAQAQQDLRALALLIGKVFGTASPYPAPIVLPPEHPSTGTSHWRGVVEDFTETEIILHTEDGLSRTIDYTAEHLHHLFPLLHKGMQLHVAGQETPSLIILEPDYLIDISRIANCFEQHGHHPLNYLVNMMKPSVNTQAILLGNLAGDILDDAINQEEGLTTADTLRRNFRDQAIEYCTCADFQPQQFKQDAEKQAQNIRQAVDVLFKTFSREKAILEPSFICEQLGLSGRVDLMTSDFRLLVEQKAGKNWNIQTGRPTEHGSFQQEPHYVQLLLYYGVLQSNFHLSFDRVNLRLLYSKYPAQQGLVVVNYLQSLFREAIAVRNLIVGTLLDVARNGFSSALSQLTPETLNVNQSKGVLFLKYKQPQLQALTAPLHRLSPLEKAYFCRMMTFVCREQRAGKSGQLEDLTSSFSNPWNMPLAEKVETGNIIHSLKIVQAKEKTVVCNYTALQHDFLPNFRRGDIVYLYAYDEGTEPDIRHHILYKGNITDIHTGHLQLTLTEPQHLATDATYAIEHASTSSSFSAAVRSLYTFITAHADRKALLLGQRTPQRDTAMVLSRSYHPDYDDVILHARQARDYYLVVGPPGTGKTSMALQFMVREELTEEGGALLLMSYTNRAVDEICGMLNDNGIDYLRIGSEYSCDPRFKDHLLSSVLGERPRLSDIRAYIKEVRIVVGTTSMIQSRSFILSMKHFSLAIIDEASQILEPGLIGLLASPSIDRFILIGDHKQLPAVVQQSERDARVEEPLLRAIGLTDCRQSLFERLLHWERSQGREAFIGTLRKQGRMHPDIAAWPNRMFYSQEQLQPVPLPHQLEPTSEPRLVFIPSAFCQQPDMSDKVNTDEARIIAAQLKKTYEACRENFQPQKTVGVIVPYRNQIAMIRQEVEKLKIPPLQDISIDTVERYQGSQRDTIIYSFTVQHPYQLLFLTANTFMEDGHLIDRKLNVILTRARKRLILTGNEQILRLNPLFSNLLDYIDKEKKSLHTK